SSTDLYISHNSDYNVRKDNTCVFYYHYLLLTLIFADYEVSALILFDRHQTPGDDAEGTPLDERLDRPREVVVQARQRDVGRRVRVVDRMHLAAADERLARVEVPAEERVHEAGDRHDLPPGLGREKVVVDDVALVHRRVRVEVHRHPPSAGRARAAEHRVAFHRRRQGHRAVRAVLLHRLEREWVVQQVDVVHQRALLDPLAREVVPPAEPVDDQLVARLRAQVERLVGDALAAEGVTLATVLDRRQPL